MKSLMLKDPTSCNIYSKGGYQIKQLSAKTIKKKPYKKAAQNLHRMSNIPQEIIEWPFSRDLKCPPAKTSDWKRWGAYAIRNIGRNLTERKITQWLSSQPELYDIPKYIISGRVRRDLTCEHASCHRVGEHSHTKPKTAVLDIAIEDVTNPSKTHAHELTPMCPPDASVITLPYVQLCTPTPLTHIQGDIPYKDKIVRSEKFPDSLWKRSEEIGRRQYHIISPDYTITLGIGNNNIPRSESSRDWAAWVVFSLAHHRCSAAMGTLANWLIDSNPSIFTSNAHTIMHLRRAIERLSALPVGIIKQDRTKKGVHKVITLNTQMPGLTIQKRSGGLCPPMAPLNIFQ